MTETKGPSDPGWHLEDFEVGQSHSTMARTITEADLVAFVGLGGFFEEIFITAAPSGPTALGPGRVVPGLLTLVFAEGLYVLTGRVRNGLALLSLADVTWTAPVKCGDTIRSVITVESTRRSESRPDRGIVTTGHRVVDSSDSEVLRYRTSRLIRARPGQD